MFLQLAVATARRYQQTVVGCSTSRDEMCSAPRALARRQAAGAWQREESGAPNHLLRCAKVWRSQALQHHLPPVLLSQPVAGEVVQARLRGLPARLLCRQRGEGACPLLLLLARSSSGSRGLSWHQAIEARRLCCITWRNCWHGSRCSWL